MTENELVHSATLNAMDLRGSRIVVTGASSGIGRVTARILSQLGATLALVARDEVRLQQSLDRLNGGGHQKYVFDLTNANGIPKLLKEIADKQGPLTGLFHSAGILSILPVRVIKEAHIQSVLAPGLHAALMLVRGFCQKGISQSGKGSIVFMSSVAGHRGERGMSIYCADKAAIDGALRSLACELADRNIRVNSIVAGAVRTEMHEAVVNSLTEEGARTYEKHHLLGFGEPEDVGYAAAFLLSDAAKWITGTSMVVDGGFSCH